MQLSRRRSGRTMSAAFMEPGSIVWDLDSVDKFDAIRETVLRSSVFAAIPGLDPQSFADVVVAREQEQSTGFGYGIAIAHGRTATVQESAVALGVSRQGIAYQSVDGLPVHLLFVVGSHPERQIDYLQILSSLAALGRNTSITRDVLSCICCEDAQSVVRKAVRPFAQRVGRM